MKTAHQIKRERYERRVANHYAKLMTSPGAMKTACIEATQKKFSIAKEDTVRAIVKRVASRLETAQTPA